IDDGPAAQRRDLLDRAGRDLDERARRVEDQSDLVGGQSVHAEEVLVLQRYERPGGLVRGGDRLLRRGNGGRRRGPPRRRRPARAAGRGLASRRLQPAAFNHLLHLAARAGSRPGPLRLAFFSGRFTSSTSSRPSSSLRRTCTISSRLVGTFLPT